MAVEVCLGEKEFLAMGAPRVDETFASITSKEVKKNESRQEEICEQELERLSIRVSFKSGFLDMRLRLVPPIPGLSAALM